VGTEYGAWFRMLEEYFKGFSEAERVAVFGETASWVYGL
jgi:hypothetical protein